MAIIEEIPITRVNEREKEENLLLLEVMLIVFLFFLSSFERDNFIIIALFLFVRTVYAFFLLFITTSASKISIILCTRAEHSCRCRKMSIFRVSYKKIAEATNSVRAFNRFSRSAFEARNRSFCRKRTHQQ